MKNYVKASAYSDIKNKIRNTVDEAVAAGPDGTTYWVDLDYDNAGNRWAVVFGWMDDGEGNPLLCGKIAYLPKNSGMQEYDMDWEMPYDEETGEVWDTELSISNGVGDADINWWIEQWDMIKNEYINTEDDGIESATKINCVGHNDSGQYYDLIDYFDVWGNEEDGWVVNNLGPIEEKIWISDDITEEELFNYLKDTIGYFNKNTKFSDVIIEWNDPDFIEFFQADNYYPFGRLQKSYTK